MICKSESIFRYVVKCLYFATGLLSGEFVISSYLIEISPSTLFSMRWHNRWQKFTFPSTTSLLRVTWYNEIERCGTQEETINNLICQSRTKSLRREVGTDILLPCVIHCSFATSQRDSTLKRIKGWNKSWESLTYEIVSMHSESERMTS